MAAKVSGSVCAAQPVTTMRASGRSRLSLRIAWRACRTASAVTAQVFTTTASARPAPCALAADHLRLVGVEPAAEGDDLDAHRAAPLRRTARDRSGPRTRTRPARSSARGRRARAIRSEIAARQRHRHLAVGAAQPRRRDRSRASGRAAGLGEPGAALPGAHHDVLARFTARARCWRAREISDGFPASGPILPRS